jgi:manganese/iron transport system ATP-binding protein
MTFVEPALVLDSVATAYDRELVLEGVTGSVDAGGALALIGPNGAGKTTLIKAILGLVPLTSGRIVVLGTDPEDARPRVAYVPQAEALDPEFPISVLQVVLTGRYRMVGWLRRPTRADRSRALAALEEVGLADRARERFGVLSGGQRQRVLLARAVAQEARLLLLDEPFTGVDATTTEALLGVLGHLRADGVAVVMSTHDLSVAHLVCDEACLLNHHQVAFGPIGEALSADLLRATYGGSALLLEDGATLLAR